MKFFLDVLINISARRLVIITEIFDVLEPFLLYLPSAIYMPIAQLLLYSANKVQTLCFALIPAFHFLRPTFYSDLPPLLKTSRDPCSRDPDFWLRYRRLIALWAPFITFPGQGDIIMHSGGNFRFLKPLFFCPFMAVFSAPTFGRNKF